MIKIFRDRQNTQYHNISEKIIDMIQRYYDTDLTLEICAAEASLQCELLKQRVPQRD